MGYNIIQASTQTGISRDMIRHYEKLGLIHPKRQSNGYRTYSEDELLRLVLIRYYSNMGISLKKVAEIFRTGDVAQLLERLETETDRLEELLHQMTARLEASRHTIQSLHRYAGKEPYVIQPIGKRYLYSKGCHTAEEFTALCGKLNACGYFFQYYYEQEAVWENGRVKLLRTDQGAILYEPLPFSVPDCWELPEQMYYQTTQQVAVEEYIGEEKLEPHMRVAARETGRNRFCVYSYEIFRPNEPNGSIISIEIPLGRLSLC